MRSNVTSLVSLSLLVACTVGCSSAEQDTTSTVTVSGSGEDTGLQGSSESGDQTSNIPTTDASETTGGPGGTDTATSDVTSPSGTDTGMTGTTGLTGSTGTTEGPQTDTGSSSDTGLPPDADMDGVADADDNCPDAENPDQGDADKDGIGDACDEDDDDDTILDAADNCPLVANTMQEDLDKDGIGDACDDDVDGDTVPNDDDNCPLIPNVDQKDLDKDLIGDVCDADKDGDAIPDEGDVFPDDPNQPGIVIPKKIYAHSASALSTVDVADYTVVKIGPFMWPNGNDSMTDIAIDRYGVLYGVSFSRAYVCNPTTAKCFDLGALGGSYNGLTWIPAGIIDPDKDSLIGIGNNGSWNHLTFNNKIVSAKQLGSYGPGYTSAGDAFSIEGIGTYAAVNKNGAGGTVIVTVDPLTGKVMNELAVTQGFFGIYGLAGWEGLILAFDSSGTVIKIDPMTKVVTNLGKKSESWWGAGVGTLLPQ